MVDNKGGGVSLIQSHYLRIPTPINEVTLISHNDDYVTYVSTKLNLLRALPYVRFGYTGWLVGKLKLLHQAFKASSFCNEVLPLHK